MSQLPGVAGVTVPDDKIIKYLLDPSHTGGGAGKAKFFGLFGFSQANWFDLKKALFNHPFVNPVTAQRSSSHGEYFEVSCSLETPDGRNPCIVSVWIIRPGDPAPQLVTAKPRKLRRGVP